MVDVERPHCGIVKENDNPVLTVEELSGMDDIEFQLNELDDSPGVFLQKEGYCTWTPISSWTRSRIRGSTKTIQHT